MDELATLTQKLHINTQLTPRLLHKELKNIQKCLLSENIFNDLSLKPGSIVCVDYKSKQYICKAFQRFTQPENNIEFDDSVCVMLNRELSDSVSIKLLPSPKPLNKITVRVVFTSLHDLLLWNDRENDLHVLIKKHLLPFYIFADNCEVSTQTLSKYTHIDKLIINYNDEGCGYVVDKTKLTVLTTFKEHYDMENKRFQPVYGLDDIADRLIDVVRVNEAFFNKCRNNAIQPCKQILLIGPSGSGKSSLIPIVAQSTNCPIVSINSCDVISSEPGESESKLRQLFERAFQCCRIFRKCIINLDEIDTLCPKREESRSHIQRSTTQLLQLLDKAQTQPGIVVFATTNKPECLEPALRRHGRLGIEIYVSPPTEQQRSIIITNLIKHIELNLSTADLDKLSKYIASITPGFVGADIKFICQKIRTQTPTNDLDRCMRIFRDVVTQTKPISLKGAIGVVTTMPQSFDDIGGIADIRKSLEMTILWPIKHPESFARMGLKQPRGVLLHGPPGCAKTSIVRALASLGSLSLLSISAAELYSPYVGDAEQLIVQLFQRARQNSPCILFIDEIDTLAGSRGETSEKSSDVQDRILAALLTQMDGVGIHRTAADLTYKSSDGVIVIGATNRPDMLDAALLRPGRFDRHIYVPAPDRTSRLQILKIVTRNMPLADDVDLDEVAANTEFYSGADLKSLCTEAGLSALTTDGMDVDIIRYDHFKRSLSSIRPSLTYENVNKHNLTYESYYCKT